MKKIKLPKKTAESKKVVSQKKKVQPKKKSNVIAFPTKAKKAPIAKEKQPPAPPKVHPFAHFMKDRFANRDFGKQTRKLGSFGVYRKKAI